MGSLLDNDADHFLSHLKIGFGKQIGREATQRGDYDLAQECYEMALNEIDSYRSYITDRARQGDIDEEKQAELVQTKKLLDYWERTIERELERL